MRVCDELLAHQKTKPAMEREFCEVDRICIELATRANAAKAAGSPTFIELDATLRQERYRREAIRQAWTDRLHELQRQAELFSRPEIVRYNESALTMLKNLSKMARIREEREGYTPDGFKRITVEYNLPALREAREKILASITTVRQMIHQPVAAIRQKIAELEAEFLRIDLDAMTATVVTPTELQDMKARPEPGTMTSGYLMSPNSPVVKVGVSTAEVVSDMIEQLHQETARRK